MASVVWDSETTPAVVVTGELFSQEGGTKARGGGVQLEVLCGLNFGIPWL